LFACATLIVEPDDPFDRAQQAGHDETSTRIKLAWVPLDSRHRATCDLPTLRPVAEVGMVAAQPVRADVANYLRARKAKSCFNDAFRSKGIMRMRRVLIAAVAAYFPFAAAAAPLAPAEERAIDDSVQEWLVKTGAPSVSIAVVSGGGISYAKAYGNARLDPDKPATTDTRYAIDSVSKEFAASAMLLLQEEGELSLDDHVAKYFPALAGADTVTVRQILSHTAGYRDYWPQDYVMPEMTKPVTVDALLKEWATKPLDFAPGTDWQYSNTGYVIAGAIVEKVSGQKLVPFLDAHIFAPLAMTRVTEDDSAPLSAADAGAYTRYGNGPIRHAPKEGAGWLFAAGELAMNPGDLARWDISLMDRSLLKPQSYDALYTSVKLKSGKDTHYSLGLHVADEHGHFVLSHTGGGSGFLAANTMWPKEKTAIVALTNNDWAGPGGVVARVAYVVVPPTPAEARARAVFDGLQHGTVDRALFTDNANAYLSPAALADHKAGLGALGPVRTFSLDSESERGGMHTRVWNIVTANAALTAVERGYAGGKLEQFMVSKTE
jgi:D-alanyl-D-alanine carboxypeptidase